MSFDDNLLRLHVVAIADDVAVTDEGEGIVAVSVPAVGACGKHKFIISFLAVAISCQLGSPIADC